MRKQKNADNNWDDTNLKTGATTRHNVAWLAEKFLDFILVQVNSEVTAGWLYP